LENINAADKKEIQHQLWCKNKIHQNENLVQYSTELKGSIILSIDNVKQRISKRFQTLNTKKKTKRATRNDQ
jgi:hypothetical protein